MDLDSKGPQATASPRRWGRVIVLIMVLTAAALFLFFRQAIPYVLVSESKSYVMIVGRAYDVHWTPADDLSDGYMLVVDPDDGRTNRTAEDGTRPWPHQNIRLFEHQQINVFGSRVCGWACTARIEMSDDGEKFAIELSGTGGGSEGAALRLNWGYDHASRRLNLTVIEQNPGHRAREASFVFKVHDRQKISLLEGDGEFLPSGPNSTQR